jgi:hypothetical protein
VVPAKGAPRLPRILQSSVQKMARPYGGHLTCESCKSIDVRRWHRDGRLRPGQYFSWSWTCGGEPSANINVRTEANAVVLRYRSRSYGATEWKSRRSASPAGRVGTTLRQAI